MNAINFCTSCGKPITLAIPEGDNRERHICLDCGEIQYQNPKIITGCLPVWKDKILMCKRAIEPRYGTWTLPAGFMENGETIEEGAKRETWEEALAEVEDLELYQIFNVPQVSQIYMLFRAKLKDPHSFGPGTESLEVKLVKEHEIPWQGIAFRVIEHTLKRFLKEKQSNQFTLSIETME